jgi:hypothetical protein
MTTAAPCRQTLSGALTTAAKKANGEQVGGKLWFY